MRPWRARNTTWSTSPDCAGNDCCSRSSARCDSVPLSENWLAARVPTPEYAVTAATITTSQMISTRPWCWTHQRATRDTSPRSAAMVHTPRSHGPRCDQRRPDGPNHIARDREADARRLRVAELGVDGRERRDPDDPAREIHQRTPRVSGVDLRARLDQSGELHLLRLRDVAVER